MKITITRLGLTALCLLLLPPVSAGPIRDKIAEQSQTRRQMSEQTGAPHQSEGLEEADGKSGDIALPEGVRAERNIAYGPDAAQKLDVYLPQQATAAPVLFMVHGGAWMVGDKAAARVVTNKMRRWVPKGFILMSVNYRLAPKADPLEQANDVATALAYAQSRAKNWGGDPARFVLMGHSAGAHLVSLLSADPGIATRQGAKPWLGTVALDSAAFDVPRIMKARHQRFYDRVFKNDPDYWRQASPIYRLSSAGAPMLLVCSSLRQDSCPQARSFAAKATEKGGKASVLPVALSHGEINQNLGLAGEFTEAVEAFLQSIGVNMHKK